MRWLIIVGLLAWIFIEPPWKGGESANASSFEEEVAELASFLRTNEIGDGTDVWLVRTTMWHERLVLVFGYADDYAACLDIKRGLEQQFWKESYVCEYADQ